MVGHLWARYTLFTDEIEDEDRKIRDIYTLFMDGDGQTGEVYSLLTDEDYELVEFNLLVDEGH